ncbi:MAG: methionyl-tRNA formyltransferase [Acidobacteria bacterium]|nr:methionyl-tRNA formyltransferase [Acidobacteriota bacterium]
MRLLFMGTPLFAVPSLKALLFSHHTVSAVFTQPDKPSGRGEKLSVPPVKRLALEQGIPVHQPEKLKAPEWQPVFAELTADAYVVVAYGQILPQWLLDLPRLGAYNVHASLLPKYRGAAPIHWAIANGETKTGITTMKLDAGMDTGDMLLQHEIPIEPEDTCASIHDRLAEIGAELMLRTLEGLEKATAKRIPQDPALASYAPMLKKSDGLLDWSQSAISLHNRIRAFNPWPGTYTQLQGQTLRIWKAQPAEVSGELPSGTLLHHGSGAAVVACGTGFLRLKEVQLENRRRTPALDFLHGIRLGRSQTLILGR